MHRVWDRFLESPWDPTDSVLLPCCRSLYQAVPSRIIAHIGQEEVALRSWQPILSLGVWRHNWARGRVGHVTLIVWWCVVNISDWKRQGIRNVDLSLYRRTVTIALTRWPWLVTSESSWISSSSFSCFDWLVSCKTLLAGLRSVGGEPLSFLGGELSSLETSRRMRRRRVIGLDGTNDALLSSSTWLVNVAVPKSRNVPFALFFRAIGPLSEVTNDDAAETNGKVCWWIWCASSHAWTYSIEEEKDELPLQEALLCYLFLITHSSSVLK